MAFDFTGKRAVVCGGSRGIGRSIALGFAQAGAAVSICARGAEALEATRREIARFGHAAHAGVCDLADGDAIRGYVAEAAGTLGGIDVLINNASGFGSTDDEAGWAASVAVDMMAIVRATQAALPFLKETKGTVVNTSSISALRTSARTAPYGAIKAAVIQYTSTQAAMYARDGIRVNGVAQGRSSFPEEAGKSASPTIPTSTTRSCARYRSAGLVIPRSWPTSCCSSPRRSPHGLPVRPSWSTAVSCYDFGAAA
jgi:3-oxoacyl-[acyl-carrier protein] reductase